MFQLLSSSVQTNIHSKEQHMHLPLQVPGMWPVQLRQDVYEKHIEYLLIS